MLKPRRQKVTVSLKEAVREAYDSQIIPSTNIIIYSSCGLLVQSGHELAMLRTQRRGLRGKSQVLFIMVGSSVALRVTMVCRVRRTIKFNRAFWKRRPTKIAKTGDEQ